MLGVARRYPRASAVLAVVVFAAGTNYCRGGESKPHPAESDRTACNADGTQVQFRGRPPLVADASQPDYMSVIVTGDGKIGVDTIQQQFFGDHPSGLDSLEAANPRDVKAAHATVQKGHKLIINLSDTSSHAVDKTESAASYARTHNLNTSAFLCVNGISASHKVKKGQRTQWPQQASLDKGQQVAVIKPPTDTYSKVANAFHVKVSDIVANNKLPTGALRRGDIIYTNHGDGGPAASDNPPAPTTSTTTLERGNKSPDTLLENFVKKYSPVAQEIEKSDNIPQETLLAQAALESSKGTSKLAVEANNLLSIKADERWTGPVYIKQTTENNIPNNSIVNGVYNGFVVSKQVPGAEPNTSDITVDAPFRKYATPEDSLRDFPKFLKSRGNYKDAFGKDARGFIDSLVDDNGPRYATDPNYAKSVNSLIDKIQALNAPSPNPPNSPGMSNADIFKSYKGDDKHFERGADDPNNNSFCTLKVNGVEKRTAEVTDDQRLTIIRNNLDAVVLTQEGLDNFKVNDLTDEIKADPELTNFDGGKNGVPQDEAPDYYVLHFTGNPGERSVHYDGLKQAKAMQNAGGKTAVNDYIRDDGEANHLTDDAVNQVRSHNTKVRGVEIAGCEQAALTPAENESAFYLSIKNLKDNGWLKKDGSASQAVNEHLRGHEELPAAKGSSHTDWPKIVMDMFREKLIALLVSIGYQQ